MNAALVLQLVLTSAKLLSEERQRYYEKEAGKLLAEIDKQEDAEFSKKDMNKKGQAERELKRRTEALGREVLGEARGTK